MDVVGINWPYVLLGATFLTLMLIVMMILFPSDEEE